MARAERRPIPPSLRRVPFRVVHAVNAFPADFALRGKLCRRVMERRSHCGDKCLFGARPESAYASFIDQFGTSCDGQS